MSNALKMVLSGIVLILASLFFMGVCILNARRGDIYGLVFIFFVVGVIVSVIGLFFVDKKNED